jgi:cyclic beta-1,2-glucan synthetase
MNATTLSFGLEAADSQLAEHAFVKEPARPDQWVRQGRALAASHVLEDRCQVNYLLKRLAMHESALREVHAFLDAGLRAGKRIHPAAEWLLDNFYLVSDQLVKTKKHFPKNYHRDLPGLLNAAPTQIPRVYDISLRYITYCGGNIVPADLAAFIEAYQSVKPLKQAEIWAIPVMLRLVLFEHLERIAWRIAHVHRNESEADEWVEQLLQCDENGVVQMIGQSILRGPNPEPVFIAEVIRQLRRKGSSSLLASVESSLKLAGFSITEIMRTRIRQQAADQLDVSHYLGSLRLVITHDWRNMVEEASAVHHVLKQDPHGSYAFMDFATRDRYRQMVAQLGKDSNQPEKEIASLALQLSIKGSFRKGANDRAAHIGYYLVDKGVEELRFAAGIRPLFAQALYAFAKKYPLVSYLLPVALMTALLATALLLKAWASGAGIGWLICIAMLSVISASQPAIHFINWLITLLIRPAMLPRMDYAGGLPAHARTLVVVPAMLRNAEEVMQLVNMLEIRYLANKGPHIHFGLLTDFRDAPRQSMPEDDALLQLVQEKIEGLNKKYHSLDSSLFFLFHRPRRWNRHDGTWMGYERKRGKLEELNALLRGNDKGFCIITGKRELFPFIKYVITLDADTQLPRDAAWKMVGGMAHPLNRAILDLKKQQVMHGYGMLQPRVSVSMPEAGTSFYAKMHAHDHGIDPYTRASSDVYQDLFDEGSFIGKGIYEVDIFMQSTRGRFPENRILSHDLLEGCYARAGLLSDVVLYEQHPVSYQADVKRRHRWIRGDWQIAPWAFSFMKPGLSPLSRWKILDNLRRSLVPAALLLLMVLGWTVLQQPVFWAVWSIGVIFFPALVAFASALGRNIRYLFTKMYWRDAVKASSRSFVQSAHALVCMPHEAFYSMDAVLRTLWRVMVSKRNLLEWEPSQTVRPAAEQGAVRVYFSMWASPLIALALAVYAMTVLPAGFFLILAMAAVWISAPVLTYIINRTGDVSSSGLSLQQQTFLRVRARKTWAFFEEFVGPHDNWLPPDHFQEYPVKRIAHRTSPTNIGLSLLAGLAARDMGYITSGQLITRTGHTMHTLAQMERYHGHFYNWYDTQSLKPIAPKYISTVDSGNLAGHLLTFRQGLLEIPHQEIFDPVLLQGLRDLATLISKKDHTFQSLEQLTSALDNAWHSPPSGLREVMELISGLRACSGILVQELSAEKEHPDFGWAMAIDRQLQAMEHELAGYAPWLKAPGAPLKPGLACMDHISTLSELPDLYKKVRLLADECEDDPISLQWLIQLEQPLEAAERRVQEKLQAIARIEAQCTDFSRMEYGFLYNTSQRLLAIGYNTESQTLDAGCYDLLASEARLAAFIAISQGCIPEESWFALGRPLVQWGEGRTLLSWSGSMFEYLMPELVMPSYNDTLLHEANKVAVQVQAAYGREHGIPWGFSECAYNAIDINLNYQYSASGVPDLGLKRGLGEELVVAPYASMLALMVDPAEACRNLQQLSSAGAEGRFGYYEAVQFEAAGKDGSRTNSVVRSFMAHHQGMSLLSLLHTLHNRPMQKRFEREPMLTASLLLLQERLPPKAVPETPVGATTIVPEHEGNTQQRQETIIPPITSPHTPSPEVQLLSNGRYHVMVTNAGSGYARWRDISVTRWREDAACDGWGNFCFVRDNDTGYCWSAAHQPSLAGADEYRVDFSNGRAIFFRRDGDIGTSLEITVSPEDDLEIRRLVLTNHSDRQKDITLTSYSEPVLAPEASDASHPAFSKLFIETKIIPQQQAVMCVRRPRSQDEQQPVYFFHLMKASVGQLGEVSYETDRMRFIGRGNNIHRPAAMRMPGHLSNTSGTVLDAISAMRSQIFIPAGSSVTIDLVWGISDSSAVCEKLLERMQDAPARDNVLALSAAMNKALQRQINSRPEDVEVYRSLAGALLFSPACLRAAPEIIRKNRRTKSGLWTHSISGDLPIVLLRMKDPANIDLAEQLLSAHAYWRLKGLHADLVIWNEDVGVHKEFLQAQIMGLMAGAVSKDLVGKPGGVFVMQAAQLPEQDRVLLQALARVVIADNGEPLLAQLQRMQAGLHENPLHIPEQPYEAVSGPRIELPALRQFNGTGGFSEDGSEYVIITNAATRTPMPWVNVIANPQFGTVISENGQCYTWSVNAHEYRLTPWNNDPVTDSSGEKLYVRDEADGHWWSPVGLSGNDTNPMITRHGFGYSSFERQEHELRSDTTVYVHKTESVKFTVLKLHNLSARKRRLRVTAYAELVLGDVRGKTMQHIITESAAPGLLLAANPLHNDLPELVSFFSCSNNVYAYTCNRLEFTGRNGNADAPAALRMASLSGCTGAALDPCAALQTNVDLEAGESCELVFVLGVGNNRPQAVQLAKQYASPEAASAALLEVQAFWQHTLGSVQVHTPDESLNLLTNGWLLYQTLSSRIWARSGYYQSGGAFGFRDQLQDVMALMHVDASLARKQVLLCAAHQFPEGDVLHWWHPPLARGVRTHCSDDFLWLPFVTCRYLEATGDDSILNEQVPFLEGCLLNRNEESNYDLFIHHSQHESLYTHCVRAIQHGTVTGVYGLPLMGSGDWNDSMDKVGRKGKGESVWLGFFLYHILQKFEGVARAQGDELIASFCKQKAGELNENLERHGWDGGWYRRAFFDDGTPLGSAENAECSMDSISQSWAVLSGAADPGRARMAMQSAFERLADKSNGLVKLIDPAFVQIKKNPGYVKAYPKGIRENGGQYTHAAIWMIMAYAAMGERELAWELFSMINPLNHADTPAKMAVYQVEPYVVAADVYSAEQHTGRGGWTWYTGSAGWMYQLVIEWLLGLRRKGNSLEFAPCLPCGWQETTVRYRFGGSTYHITISHEYAEWDGVCVTLDGAEQDAPCIPLVEDGKDHRVTVKLKQLPGK